ncbi:unnamed protein product [[Candida] boidinii]|nr:unnamed protein product [[Candida] boidinii]
MFLNQKKQRLLGITACLITLVLVISLLNKESPTSNGFNIPNISVDDVSSKTNANNLVKDNSGHIDESKVRLVEEETQRQVQKKKQEAAAEAALDDSNDIDTTTILKDTAILKDTNSKDNKKDSISKDTATKDTASNKKKPIDKKLDDSKSSDKSKIVTADKTDKAIDDTADVNKINKLKNPDTKKSNAINDDDDEDDEQSILRFDPIKEFNEILSMSPVVIFSKSYCPYSKKLKNLLQNSSKSICCWSKKGWL